MVRVGALASVVVAIAGLVSGCGGSSGDAVAEREAEMVAVAWAEALWHLDFHKACALEFTNRHGPPYRGKTEADKKRECERGWKVEAVGPGEIGPSDKGEIKRVFGLQTAVPEGATMSGQTAVVTLRDPGSGRPREFRMREEDGRWVVYEETYEDMFGP